MLIKHKIPEQQYRRLRREYKLTNLPNDSATIKEDSRKYDTCIVRKITSDDLARNYSKCCTALERDKNKMILAYSGVAL